MSGTLYLVATPIGNLEDITHRAVRVLGEADLIACEDTRHSRKLLDHYGIERPTISYYRENEHERGPELIARLRAGASIALITDAGAPGVSDPGVALVRAAVEAGITVVPVPGASAPVTALMASGFASEPVAYAGFLPARAGDRRRALEGWKQWPGTVVLFEAPHRMAAALADMEEVLGGGRGLVVARELTKIHEEFVRGTVAQARALTAGRQARGEYTLVLGPALAEANNTAGGLEQQLAGLAALPHDEQKAGLKQLARTTGMARSELYRRLQQRKG